MTQDRRQALQEQVIAAAAARQPLHIRGGRSKAFYGRETHGEKLDVSTHRGIIHYEPTELVLTARCGTPLAEIERHLKANKQRLAFEPPGFAGQATLGGAVACGLAGPGRPYHGSVRDAVLGVRCINGRGEVLRFGGEVVKNVAGFDVSRLMTGALGTLGVLLDVSLKVLPCPEFEATQVFELDEAAAVAELARLRRQSLPVTATAFDDGRLYVRLSGMEAGVQAAQRLLGGETLAEDTAYWRALREHQHEFFRTDGPLWRLSVPPATAMLKILGDWLYEWGGAQRWLKTALQSTIIREMAVRAGGTATLFRGGDRQGQVFHPLTAPVARLHQRLKAAFDPHRLFNPGCLYPEL